jgi:hydroxypyruvate reductase
VGAVRDWPRAGLAVQAEGGVISQHIAAADAGPCADLRALFAAAVHAVSAEAAMPRRLPDPPHGQLVIIAVGKAAAEMMRVAQVRARGQQLQGLVVTRHGHLPVGGAGWPNVEVIEAGHPYPDANSVRAAERALEIARGLHAGDHLLVFLSGGGSALLAAPAAGLDLGDKQAVTRALLQSGATISEINCVRKHLSRIKGGRLAVAAGAAQVTTWVISDVPGDDPSLVSSGPTVADPTTLAMAREILARYGIHPYPQVRAALSDPINETPPADSPGLKGSETLVIARARDALTAAGRLAASLGYQVTDLGDRLQTEARLLGAEHAALARRFHTDGTKRAVISGGETTVTVANKRGRGGRNLEYLLSLAIALDGAPGIYALAADTDGIDGTENAAGAVVTPDTIERARRAGLDAVEHLMRNDAYVFFERLGDLLVTGPTLTNVNDFRAILIDCGRPVA